MTTAAAGLSLTGRWSLQGRQAEQGLRLWAAADEVALTVVDDAGSAVTVREVYRRWLDDAVEILLGPYGSGQVRHVIPLVSAEGTLLWNHGGSADDLARPLVAGVCAPASSYFLGAVDLAKRMGLAEVIFVRGRGSFARAVVTGGSRRASELGMATEVMAFEGWGQRSPSRKSAVLVVGTFEDDVELVRELPYETGLIGAVGAGLTEFGVRLGRAAEGVVAPVQWVPTDASPEVGPSGVEFARGFEASFGRPPDYVAAQAAAAGFLSAEAHRRGYGPAQIMGWETTTLLGRFALDDSWRQVGHSAITVRWHQGRQIPLDEPRLG